MRRAAIVQPRPWLKFSVFPASICGRLKPADVSLDRKYSPSFVGCTDSNSQTCQKASMGKEKPPEAATVPLQINCRNAFQFRKLFPDCPALYVAVHPIYGILYIGITKSLKRRMRQHYWALTDTRIAWVTGLAQHEQRKVEKFLIHTCDPAWNIRGRETRLKQQGWRLF